MRKRKTKLILFLMIISLFTVGFASWINSPTDDLNANGDFTVDDVLLLNALSSPRFNTELIYNEKGFITFKEYDSTTQTFVDKSYDNITYSVNVDLPLCFEKIKDADAFQIRIILKNNIDYDYISTILDLIDVTVIVDDIALNSSEITSITNNEIITNISIPKDNVGTNSSKVQVVYNFSGVSTNEVNDEEKEHVEKFFMTLKDINDDTAFIVAASLHPIYD